MTLGHWGRCYWTIQTFVLICIALCVLRCIWWVNFQRSEEQRQFPLWAKELGATSPWQAEWATKGLSLLMKCNTRTSFTVITLCQTTSLGTKSNPENIRLKCSLWIQWSFKSVRTNYRNGNKMFMWTTSKGPKEWPICWQYSLQLLSQGKWLRYFVGSTVISQSTWVHLLFRASLFFWEMMIQVLLCRLAPFLALYHSFVSLVYY